MMTATGLFLLSLLGWQQEEGPARFAIGSELVLVDVQVLDRKTGVARDGLKPADFELREAGEAREILQFGRDEHPLSVVLLFDLTDSVRPILKRLAEEARSALGGLRAEDEVAVMVYSGSAALVDGFTLDRDRTRGSIERAARMKSPEAAFFNEALWQAAKTIERDSRAGSRRVVVWLTDNIPNAPTPQMRAKHAKSLPADAPLHTREEAVRALHEAGVTVATLLGRDSDSLLIQAISQVTERSAFRSYPPGNVNEYAQWTGGQVVKVERREAGAKLSQLLETLRARYVLGFRPGPGAEGVRKLQVELRDRDPRWKVLSREAYVRPGEAKAPAQ